LRQKTQEPCALVFRTLKARVSTSGQRGATNTRSSRPITFSDLVAAQEIVVLCLRRALLLPLDDLLAVTREFIYPHMSRAQA
jgi:hypothetical protein